MATSGNFSTSNQYIKYRIVVTENSTSVSDNTSSVNVKVQAWRTNQGYTTYGSGTCYCNIDGTNYSQSITPSQKFTYNSYTEIFNKTVTVNHNADGSKTIYVSAYINHNRFSSNSQGFNVTLTNIPRQANLTSAPNFYDVDNPTITYSNPAGNAVSSLQACISLTGSQADIAYRDISKTGTSYTFNLTTAERRVLRSACPNSNTLAVKFYVKTVISGTTYYSILDRTMTVKDANPSIMNVTYKDSNSTTVAVTTNDQYIIQNKSQLQIKIGQLSAAKSAKLSSVTVTINEVGYTTVLSGTVQTNITINFGTIDTIENATAKIEVTDSRGNKKSTNITILVYAYSAPAAIGTAKRDSNFYTDTKITNNSFCSSLGGHNTLSVVWKYKERTASSYTTGGSIAYEETITAQLDNTKSWDIQFVATDVFETTTYNVVVPVGIPLMYFDTKKQSIGFKTLTTKSNQIAIGKTVDILSTNNNVIGQITKATGSSGDSVGIYLYSDASSSQKLRAMLNGSGYGFLQLFDNNGAMTIMCNGASGNITCVTLTQTSSRKVKDNIKILDPEEARKILELVAVTFDFKDKAQGIDKRGFIAEDVAEVIPELVTPETDAAPASLDYIGMIPYLQEIIKEQDKRIKALEDKIEELNKKLT